MLIIATSLIFLLTFTGVFGQVPSEFRQAVPEKDWMELYCYEAKYRGGEAVAKLEAMAELLPPLIAEVEDVGVKVSVPDYAAMARDLESKLDAVCQQESLEATQAKLQEFISAAEDARSAGNDLRSQIEPPLVAKGEELRKKLEKELRPEGEAMGREAEARLRARAEQEAKAIEAELRERIKQEIEEELKARAAAGEFGEKPDMEKLLKLGQRMGEERGRIEGEKAKAELTAKYEALAEEERARITKLMEAKADEIGGEELKKLKAIRHGFENFEIELGIVSQAKMVRFNEYRDKAIQKRKEIIRAIVENQIEEGKKQILAHKEEIDKARAEGKDIPTAEELVAQLEADEQALIDKLAAGETSEADIRQAVEEMRSKWDKVRGELEKLQEQGAAEIYSRLKTELERNGYTEDKLKALDPGVGVWQDYLKKLQARGECQGAETVQGGEVQFLDTFDDFKDGSIDGQEGWYVIQDENTLQEIQGGKAKSGKAVRFYDNNPSYGNKVAISKNFDGSPQGSIEVDIMASSESNGNPKFHIIVGDFNRGEKIYTYFLTDGHFGYWARGFKHFPNDLKYELDRWYHVKIEWHPDQTFDFYVDGQKLNSAPLKNSYSGMTKIDSVRFYSDFWEANPESSKYRGNRYGDYPSLTPSVVYVDNVKVTTTPGKSSMCANLVSLARLENEALSTLKEFLSYSPESGTGELLEYKNNLLEKVGDYRRSSEIFKAKYKPKLAG